MERAQLEGQVKRLASRSLVEVGLAYNGVLKSYGRGTGAERIDGLVQGIDTGRLFSEIGQASNADLVELERDMRAWLDLIGVYYGGELAENTGHSKSYVLSSNRGPTVGVGATVHYTLTQVQPWLMATGSRVRYEWSVENDSRSRELYGQEAGRVAAKWRREGFDQWVDEVFGDPMDIDLWAQYPGMHLVKATIYLNEKAVETVTFRQMVVEGDARILAMSGLERILEAIRLSGAYLGPSLMREIGDPWVLAGQLVVVSGVLIALAGTGVGLVLEILVLIVGIVMASAQMVDGVCSLGKFLETAIHAGTEEDLEIAGKLFAEAVVKIGISSLFLILSYFGLGRVRSQVQARMNGVKLPTSGELIPGTSEHKAQRWLEYQLRKPDKFSTIREEMDPRWSRLYDTIIKNGPSGRGFESEALPKFGYKKNNCVLMDADSGVGFIPDSIKGNPSVVEWGKAYDFVEVKGWQELSNTGNLKDMVLYVKQYGGTLELIVRSPAHGDGSTYITGPLMRELRAIKAKVRTYP